MSAQQPHPHAAAQEFLDKIAQNYTAWSQTAVYNVSSLSFSRRQHIVSRLMLMTPKGVGDLNLLDRFGCSADTLLLIGVIDYLEQPEFGLRRLATCVEPGGRLILSFRNHRSVPRLLRNTAKSVWRGSRRSSLDRGTAFEAPVLDNSFVPARDFVPVRQSEGFRNFTIEYLDCSRVFWNMRLPRPVWKCWKRADEMFSCSATSWMCASGALMAYDKR